MKKYNFSDLENANAVISIKTVDADTVIIHETDKSNIIIGCETENVRKFLLTLKDKGYTWSFNDIKEPITDENIAEVTRRVGNSSESLGFILRNKTIYTGDIPWLCEVDGWQLVDSEHIDFNK